MSKLKEEIDNYCNDILSNKIHSSLSTKLAIKRFIKDRQNKNYILDYEKASYIIEFAETLVQSKGEFAGKQLKLLPWQKFIYLNLYGFYHKDNPKKRRFRKAFIFVGRKNGKTTLIIPIMLWDLLTEAGAEVYSAATQLEQSKIPFNEAKNMVMRNADLKEMIKTFRDTLVYQAGRIMALSSETDKLDGLNPSLAIVDEYHSITNEDVVGVLQTGMGSRLNPLLIIITTAGFDKNGVCYLEYERAKKILNNIFVDETYFTLLYEIDESDKWDDPKVFIKANPSLGITITEEYLKSQLVEAKQKPSLEINYRTKNINQWCSNLTSWISDTNWLYCHNKEPKIEDGMSCYLALDLSKRNDFTVLTAYFFNEGLYNAKHWFFIPEEQIDIKMKTDNVMIRTWIDEGYIEAIPGQTIDYEVISNKINEIASNYNVEALVYDPYLSLNVLDKIKGSLTVIPFEQGKSKFSEGAKEWEKAILEKKIADDNPVMRWMVSCVSLYVDANNNIKPIKPDANKSTKRIDGVITSIMAFAVLQGNKPIEHDTMELANEMSSWY